MIKPIVFGIVAAFFSSSLVLVKADDGSDPVSSKIRKAAAAGIPAGERKLDYVVCYKDGGSGVAFPVGCDEVGLFSDFVCCDDYTSCFRLGLFLCEVANGFAIKSTSDGGCPYQWTCCY